MGPESEGDESPSCLLGTRRPRDVCGLLPNFRIRPRLQVVSPGSFTHYLLPGFPQSFWFN